MDTAIMDVCAPLRIYVAGPISAPTPEQIRAHIDAAAHIKHELQVLGHYVHCPHCQSLSHFDDPRPCFSDYKWLVEYHDIMGWIAVCDAMYMMPGWDKSKGASMEHEAATEAGMWIYTELAQVPLLQPHPERDRMYLMDKTAAAARRTVLTGGVMPCRISPTLPEAT